MLHYDENNKLNKCYDIRNLHDYSIGPIDYLIIQLVQLVLEWNFDSMYNISLEVFIYLCGLLTRSWRLKQGKFPAIRKILK